MKFIIIFILAWSGGFGIGAKFWIEYGAEQHFKGAMVCAKVSGEVVCRTKSNK